MSLSVTSFEFYQETRIYNSKENAANGDFNELLNNSKESLKEEETNKKEAKNEVSENSARIIETQISYVRYVKLGLNQDKLAKRDFKVALEALNKIVDANTGEKLEFTSFNTEQQEDLLKSLSENLSLAQGYWGTWLEYSEVKIYRAEKYTWASFEYQNLDGQIQENFLKIPGATLGSGMLGDKDANRDIEELARDYVNGNTDNYFGFLKRTRGESEAAGVYDKSFLENLEKEIKEEIKRGEVLDEILGKGVNGEVYLKFEDGSGMLFGRAERQKFNLETMVNDIYLKMMDELVKNFFENQKQAQKANYTQKIDFANNTKKADENLTKLINQIQV